MVRIHKSFGVALSGNVCSGLDKTDHARRVGVTESHAPGEDKGAWISEAFSNMSNRYPRLKAAIFWHERWENDDGSYSNLRVNSSRESLKSYREGVANPFWIGRPAWAGPLGNILK